MRFGGLSVLLLVAFSWLGVTGSSGQESHALPQNGISVPNMNGVYIDPVPNEPFSATVESVSEQKLSDGSLNVLHTVTHVARDARGRTHNERRRLVAESFKDEPPIQSIHIYDPVTGRDTRLDPYTMMAQQVVFTTKPTPMAGTTPTASMFSTGNTLNSEDLGTRTYEDMLLKGTRVSRSQGAIDDYWYSEDLSIYVIHTHENAKWKQTVTVTRIERAEPDPSLFVVPEGYKVLDASPVAQAGAPGEPAVYPIGYGVSPPQLTHSVNPEFSDEARRAKFQGVCIVDLIVDISGVPRNVHVVKPLGKGLDEKAIEAVKQYRFKPAMYDGHPVPVEIKVEVSFKLF